MAINLPGGFNITNIDPIDARFSVLDEVSRLGFSAANVYEGLVVYQQDTNKLYVLVDTSLYNQIAGWQEVGSGAISNFIESGSVSASVNTTGNVFLIKSGSHSYFSISDLGQLTVSGSADDLFIIKNTNNNAVLTVSQSGVVVFATQSVELNDPAPYGGIYFTSSSLYLGLE